MRGRGGQGRVAACWTALALLGCGPPTGAGGGPDAGALGAVCQSSSDCTMSLCLPFSANYEGAAGVCSQSCVASADCPAGGVCAADFTGTLAGDVCYLACASGTTCGPDLACVWDQGALSGVCAAISVNACSSLLSVNDCTVCVANSCCSEYTACVADLTCGKDFQSCGSSCTSGFEGASDSTESMLGQCMALYCAGSCS